MKIKLYRSSAFIFFVFTFLGNLTALISGYTAVFIHEIIHLFVCCLLKEEAEGFFLDIWGMHLKIKSTRNIKKDLLIWTSGPLFSLFLSGVLFSLGMYNYFSYANLCVGVVNLLPVLPLDGGAVLNIVISHFFGTLKSDRIMKSFSLVICFLAFLLLIFCFKEGIINVSFFVFSVMLIVSHKKRQTMSVLKCGEVLTGKQKSAKKTKVVFMDSTDDFMKVLKMISPHHTLFIAVFENEKFLGFLTQKDFLNIICSSNNKISL